MPTVNTRWQQVATNAKDLLENIGLSLSPHTDIHAHTHLLFDVVPHPSGISMVEPTKNGAKFAHVSTLVELKQ